MSRKRCHRRVVVPMPPRGLRPKLATDQVRDLGIVHLQNLDAISKGEGTEEMLWHLVGGTFTWHLVAEMLQTGLDEMNAQLELATRVVERFGRTGRVGFSGPEYQLAKRGVEVMDALAEIVDKPTAIAAANMSEELVSALAAQHRERRAA